MYNVGLPAYVVSSIIARKINFKFFSISFNSISISVDIIDQFKEDLK